ncbi:hypothetical protein [Pseudooctadecabacter sp.]|uniref:hypothetical protein n=1 Tax=Pseudooctadecabacter sp. TaxID=1966338 RepID=UPI0035C7CF4F
MKTSKTKFLLAGLGLAFAGALAMATPAAAQQTITGQSYEPTIWVDPDGCTHWVMDDGFEGYMSPPPEPRWLARLHAL